MDPDANLREQESILEGRKREPREPYSELGAPRLRELREALAGWLRGGGFAPDWERCPKAAMYYRLTQRRLHASLRTWGGA